MRPQVGFYGIGSDTSKDNRVNYSFEQPYASTLLTVRPAHRVLLVSAGVEVSQWQSGPAGGASSLDRNGLHACHAPGPWCAADLHPYAGNASASIRDWLRTTRAVEGSTA